jgi:predicted HAD superfamily Cof-like phosphohydrolase
MTNFDKVREFMLACDQAVHVKPGMPGDRTAELRVNLIAEELDELREAVANNDLVEIADALTDLLYVVYGGGHAFGVDLNACFDNVHDSNMTKLDDNGKAIKNNAGKVIKGPNYCPPSIAAVLERQQA